MKRDARIGLAVVLVLGLAVTLLVGRALYKRGATTPPAESEEVAGDAPGSAEPHRDSADAASTSAAGSVAHPETASHAPEPPSVRQFIDGNTNPNASAAAHAPNATPAPVPAPLPVANTPHPQTPAPNVAGDHAAPPPPSNNGGSSAGSGWEDHEGTPATPTATQAPADGFGYVVKSGDNMWKISASVYGDGKYTQKIVEANTGMNTQKLKPGTVIRIPVIPNKTVLMKLPSFADAKLGHDSVPQSGAPHLPAEDHPVAATTHATAPVESEVPAGGTTHKVESGETLGAIAKKYYGSGGPKSVALIVSANKGLEPTKLKVGQELVIPAKK